MRLVGHENVLKTAGKICRNRPVVLLFEGPKGVGKWLAAQKLAKLTTPEYAIRYFEPHNQLKLHSVASVGDFCSCAQMYPWNSSVACFLFNDVDCMTTATASHLLKILEEPPNESAMIILTSSFPERVLSTILSRCIRLRFRLLDKEDTLLALEQSQITLPQGDFGERLLSLGSPGAIVSRMDFFREGWSEVIRSFTQEIPIPWEIFLGGLTQLESLLRAHTGAVEKQAERLELFWESLLEVLISSPHLKISPLRMAHALAQAKEVSRRGLSPRFVLESLWIKWKFVDVA